MVGKRVYQLTDLMTGITGVTPYSPAISVADDRDKILYTYYNKGRYIIHQAKDADFEAKEVEATAVDQIAAALPPFSPKQKDMVNTGLRLMDNQLDENTQMRPTRFRPKFQLDYLGGSTGVGVNTGNSSFGAQTGLAGGVDALFSDILGNNQLYAGAVLNGDIQDAGGQISYINQKRRIGWGINASHFAFQSGWYRYQEIVSVESPSGPIPLIKSTLGLERVFQQRVGATIFYPFSVTKRFEVGTSTEFYSNRVTEYNDYFTLDQFYYGSDRQRLPKGAALNLNNVQAAFVGDNSYFGFTAPLKGWRYRVGVEQFLLGDFNFTSFLADGRRYFYAKPVTFAVRGLAYVRTGEESTAFSLQYPLFAGNSFFVRGYDRNVYNAPEDTLFIFRTVGSKMLIGNFEIRLPFTGPRQLSLIKSNFLITDLNLFFDAGLSFYEEGDLKKDAFIQHVPILSTGISMRVNLMGYLVVEPYFALPLSAPESQRTWRFGLNFIPGW
jgi:hypothetical protein